MPCILRKVGIVNFKSLRNLEVPLKRFNVIVGPNGSGKTNFIEFFKFLKKALTEKQRPYAPYLEWWNYRNIVWQRKEELPITAKLSCDIDGFEVEYEVSFSGIGGIFQILGERLLIENIVSLEREGPILKIRHDKKFINENVAKIRRELRNFDRVTEILSLAETLDSESARKRFERIRIENLSEQMQKLPSDLLSVLEVTTFPVPRLPRKGSKVLTTEIVGGLPVPRALEKEKMAIVILPKGDIKSPLFHILDTLRSAIANFTVLKHPNMKEAKSVSTLREADILLEDSSNLNNILYKWFSEKLKLPERIEAVILELFPDTRIGFELTSEGKVYLKIYEREVELPPPCIPDGLYKVLAILAAAELEPSLLAIDEVENSLYKEALEYVIDELRESKSTVIIATHSPLVVDMVGLEDLLIAEKTADGTVLSRIKAPEKLRQKLAELKITQSESWLYGGLGK